MIEKVFKNEQSKDYLAYLTTLGYYLDKYISGKGMYGNRVSVMRPRNLSDIYSVENVSNNKNSEFMVVEGIRAMEMRFTILSNRQRAESPFTGEESMAEWLSAFPDAFLSQDDMRKCAKTWYDGVSKKLLSSTVTDFNKLNNFILGSMLKNLPITIVENVAQFRRDVMLTYLTQDILDADFVKRQLDLFPASREELVSLKQRILRKDMERMQMREAEKRVQAEEQNASTQEAVREQNGENEYVQTTMKLNFAEAEKIPA